MIDKDRGRGQDLCLRFFEKVQSFTPFDRMSGIRSVSSTDLSVSMPTSDPFVLVPNPFLYAPFPSLCPAVLGKEP
jgi:hypothetical protein